MSQRGEPVRLGIVGVGVIGQRHLQLANAENHCRVVALADPAPEVAEIASSTDVPHYGSFIEMLDCEPLDGVIVAAPTQVHAGIGLELVARRIPMLMEKPFTDTLESGVRLAAAADAANVAISVGHHRRFDPAVAEAREILESGLIGRLIGVSGIWAVRKPDPYFDVEWRCAPGGGPVLINIIHDIDMLRHLCGEIESVYAETTSRNRGLAVEDSGAVLLRFADGVRATISFSDAAPSPWGWERGTADNPAIPPSGEKLLPLLRGEGILRVSPNSDMALRGRRRARLGPANPCPGPSFAATGRSWDAASELLRGRTRGGRADRRSPRCPGNPSGHASGSLGREPG